MLLDHVISKPKTIGGYGLHQLVQGLTDGESPLFVDMGDKFIVRTVKTITETGTPPRSVADKDVIGFELRACVSKKLKGKHIYYPTSDWASRHNWLKRQGEKYGFEPLTLNCRSNLAKITDGKGRKFTVDQTDFVGVLKVLDALAFQKAVGQGVGSTAKAFGFGMLII